ncbi:MAG: VOC family protein [Streptosporangiaceae bacterium]
MDIRIQCLSMDTADPAAIASFWEQALGWRRTSADADEVCLEAPGAARRRASRLTCSSCACRRARQ